jgi:hypothetical protein
MEMLAKVACFWQMLAQVPKSWCCQCVTFTKNVSVWPVEAGTVCHPQFK